MTIISENPLTDDEINQIKNILSVSRCPNESLKHSFNRYCGMTDDKIFFDSLYALPQPVKTVIEPEKGCGTVNIRRPRLQFNHLSARDVTDLIVIHHTGEADIDASAEQIHQWHLAQGWSGIGYHFVIRKDGTLEIGRPEWAVGSHAYGENWHSLGIHLSGDFQQAQPTPAQIQTCRQLIRDLCTDYDIPFDRNHVVGHCDLMPTDCPGKNLYVKIDSLLK